MGPSVLTEMVRDGEDLSKGGEAGDNGGDDDDDYEDLFPPLSADSPEVFLFFLFLFLFFSGIDLSAD